MSSLGDLKRMTDAELISAWRLALYRGDRTVAYLVGCELDIRNIPLVVSNGVSVKG